MINVSIGLAFLLSVLLSPGQRLLNLFIDSSFINLMPAGKRGVLMAIVGYWLPAVIIYLTLRLSRVGANINLSKKEYLALGISNSVLILYLAARTFSATVPGGGLSFGIALYSTVTALPALVAVAFVLMKVPIRMCQPATIEQMQEPRVHAKDNFTLHGVVAFVFFGIGPIAYMIINISIADDAPFQMQKISEKRFSALCTNAKEVIHRVPKNIEGIYTEGDLIWGFRLVDNGVYGIIETESIVNNLFDGLIRFRERPSRYAYEKVDDDAKYERSFPVQKRELVDALMAQYGVFVEKISTPEDEYLGTEGYEISVKELSTNEVTATSRYIFNTKTRRICGKLTNSSFHGSDFVSRALGLEARFESWRSK